MPEKTLDFSDVLSDLSEDKSSRLKKNQLSRHELECFVAGDLGEKRAHELESLLEMNSKEQARANEIRSENLEFKKRFSFDDFESKIQMRLQSSDEKENVNTSVSFLSRFTTWMRTPSAMAATALASAAALFVFVGPAKEGVVVEKKISANSVRAKGEAQISFYVAEQTGARLGVDGEELYEGARLQFALKDDLRAQSMVIVGIDGNGEVSLLAREQFSKNGSDSARNKGVESSNIKIGKRRLLEESLVLDQAVGAERFFVIYSKLPLAELEKEAKAAAEKLLQTQKDLKTTARLEVDALSQSSVMILKKQKMQ